MTILVVGAGIMGLSVARALHKRGHRVRVFDQGPIPHARAASYDDHRLIRFPYGSMAGYARMVQDAYPAWNALWRDLGRSHYAETGTLVMSRRTDGWAADSRVALDRLDIPYVTLDPATLARRYPMIDADDVAAAYHLSSGGILKAGAILDDLAAWLGAQGALLTPHTRIAAIDAARGSVSTADGRTYDADLVVLAAGAWSHALRVDDTPPPTPSRQVVVYLTPPEPLHAAWACAPMVLEIDADAGFYLVPPAAGTRLKIGDHRFSLAGNADDPRVATDDEVRRILHAAGDRIRGLDRYTVDEARVCFYAVAPGERFTVTRHGAVWTMAGFSGHGYKFGPLLGDRLAAAIDGAEDAETLHRWAAGDD